MERGTSGTNAKLIRRLDELEAKYKQDPLIVLARLASGEEAEMTMRDFLELPDAYLIKVVAGSSLEDLNLFLERVRENAIKAQRKA